MRSTSALLVALTVVAATGCTDGAEPAGDAGRPPSSTADAEIEAATRAFCDRARSLEDAIEIDPASPDPDEIQRTAEGLGELAAVAPDGIGDQVASARRLMQEFSELLASVDVSDPSSMSRPEFQEGLARLQEQDATLGADLEEIARFIEVECGVSVDDDLTDDDIPDDDIPDDDIPEDDITEPGTAGQGVDGLDGTSESGSSGDMEDSTS